MGKRITILAITLLAFGCLAWAGGKSWTGVVSDSHCGAKHSTPSEEAAECITKCVHGGAKYVLVSDGKVYQLNAQDKFEGFAGRSVKVTGEMSGDTIIVESVEAAE
jgi:hypothetical protein